MKLTLQLLRIFVVAIGSLWFISCSTSKELADTEQDFQPSSVEASDIISNIPNYDSKLQTIEGKGRAIVSEPGNTERVTLLFASNREKSLVTIRNGIGIEGGQLLTDGDTLLVYNKVDKYIRKISIAGGELNHINQLASLNILEMINYTVSAEEVRTVLESKAVYKLDLMSGTEVIVDKESGLVQQIIQSPEAELPYSEIVYDAYGTLDGFEVPRRITIFGGGGKSKIALQLTSLELNSDLDTLTITIPDDIPVYHQ